MNSDIKTELVHCNSCCHETWHKVVSSARKERTFTDNGYPFDVSKTWTLLQCNGCDDVTLHQRVWHSDMFPEDGPDPGVYFPPRLSRRGPDWFKRLRMPLEYSELLTEIYTALHAGSNRLAMMGARAIIDLIIRRNVGDQGNFSSGLESLIQKNLISERQCTSLIAAIDAGHAAAHRSFKPESEDLHIVMDVIENLIYNELSDQDAEGLKSRTPPKPRFNKV